MSTTSTSNTTAKRVVLDYTSRDYKSIRSMLVGLAKGVMPDWQTVGETGDFGTLLLELYAYVGDVMNYYVDRVASEAFLGTAVRRQSVMYIADMLGYSPVSQRAATVPLSVTWQWDNDFLDTFTYTVTAATASSGIVTLSLSGAGQAIDIVPGQTIEVSGISVPFNGRFIVTSITRATSSDPFKLTYNITDTASYTASGTGSWAVDTGSVIILPAGTRASTSASDDGKAYVFETDYSITLDSALGKPVSPGSTRYSVTVPVSATEGKTVNPYRLGISQGIPNAEFIINDKGVIDRSVSVYTKENGQAVNWAQIDKVALASPTQSVYSIYVDDQDYTHVLFGDGSAGRIPPANSEILVGYRYGNGASANEVGVGSIVILDNEYATSLGASVSNTASPTGGANVESIESMRYSIPRAESLKQRAVTLADYTSLALQVPGVTKAVTYGANYSTVYVRIASGPQSTGWLTSTITGQYITSGTATVTLANDASLVADQTMYLDNTDGLDGSVKTTAVYFSLAGSTISSATGTGTVTVTTASNHGFKTGQPIKISGCDVAGYNGTHIITSTTATTFVFKKTGLTGSPTAGTVVGVPGFSFATAVATADEWAELSPTGTATTTDPAMQALINSLETYISDKKLVGSVVYGEPVEWTEVDLAVSVTVLPLYNRESVRAAVQVAIENVFAYNNVDFGRRISIGDVYRAALAVDGVDYLTITKMKVVGGLVEITDVNTIADDPDNAYRIPRISPTISTTWVLATGGLANT